MESLIEDIRIMNLGRFKIDVSNVPAYKKKIARREWDSIVLEMQDNPTDKAENTIKLESLIDNYGLYMIRQDFSVLRRRMPFFKALKSYIKRYILSLNYIEKCNESEYIAFQDWSYFNITGVKKKELKQTSQIQKLEIMMLEEMEKLNLSPDQLTELLQTFLRETVGNMNISVPSPKVS